MTISNVVFNSPCEDGMIVGNIFFTNGYGISLLTHANMVGYDLTFYKHSTENPNNWLSAMDEKLFAISPTNDLIDQTEEQVNNYINLVEKLSN